MRGQFGHLRGVMSLLIEFLPLILFLAAFIYKDIYAALIVLMVAMPIGLLIKYVRTRELDKMYLWSTIFLFVAGGLTLYFHNPLFLYWKPTVFYWTVAAAFVGSHFVGDAPLVKRFFNVAAADLDLTQITSKQWIRLNLMWATFFVVLGILNIYVAYNYEEPTWVNFKVFGLTILTLVFVVAQTFWIAGKITADDSKDPEENT